MGLEHLVPKTIGEALSLLNKYGNKAKVLAGGTDVVQLMKDKVIRPEYIISIGNIAELNYIQAEENSIRIGALTTIRNIERSKDLKENYGLLCQAASQMSFPSLRNTATVGGNLCNAAPSADMAPPLIALMATVKLVSTAGERTVPLEEFFTGSGHTVLKPDELMTEIQALAPPAHSAGVYLKCRTRDAGDPALVSVAALLTLNSDNDTCEDVKLALGAVAPAPIRARLSEEMLKGKQISNELISKVAQTASDESSPMDDLHGTAKYRREMLNILVRDALKQAAAMVKRPA